MPIKGLSRSESVSVAGSFYVYGNMDARDWRGGAGADWNGWERLPIGSGGGGAVADWIK